MDHLRSLLITTEMADVCVLNRLKGLQKLSLGGGIEDLHCVNKLVNLKYLSLRSTDIKDLTFIGNFPNLTWLSLPRTQVSDISPVLVLTKLEHLNIDNTQITDTSLLSALPNLNVLNAYETPLKSCAPRSVEEIKQGISCYEKDGTLKPWWKRLFW